MNHRERILAALQHETPDRCPMQISFTPEFASRLKADMRVKGKETHNPHGGGNTYDLERALEQDMLLTSVGWANSYYKEDQDYTDEWGIRFSLKEYGTKFGKGKYTEITGYPLSSDSAIPSYKAPDPSRPELYTEAAGVLKKFKKDYFIVGVVVTTIFETGWALRGLNQLLIDFLTDPDLAEAVLDIPFRYHLFAAKRLAELGADMIWTGDDVGTQRGMLLSPEIWRKFLKPKMAVLFSEIKTVNPAVRIAYHSDGLFSEIIPDLIEIGVDVLNPVQPAAMDPAEVKRKYGNRLCFWGTIDEQHTLPFGTPEDVKREIHTRLRTIGRNGGLILGPTHHVQLDTPLENFWAMVDTITNTRYADLK